MSVKRVRKLRVSYVPKEVERTKEGRTESSPESRPSNDVPVVVEMSDEFNCRISRVLRSTSE